MSDRKANCPVCGTPCIEHVPAHDGATGYYVPVKSPREVLLERGAEAAAHLRLDWLLLVGDGYLGDNEIEQRLNDALDALSSQEKHK